MQGGSKLELADVSRAAPCSALLAFCTFACAIAAVPGTEQLPTVVFAAVFVTILAFAVGFPLVQRSLPPAAGPPPPSGGAQGVEVQTPTGAPEGDAGRETA